MVSYEMPMDKIRQKAIITENISIAPGVYSMWLETGTLQVAAPGQFLLLYLPDRSRLLGRPFCIAELKENRIRVVYRAAGAGTAELSRLTPNKVVYIEAPLGHGYPLDEDIIKGGKIALIGGGLGAPSLLFLSEELKEKATAADSIRVVMGYRDSSMKHFLADDFISLGFETVISTDDGSEGIRGNVIDALKETGYSPDLIYACGPMPMLSAVKKYASEEGALAYISLEEHMACGVGVCLGCVTKTVKEDPHSHVRNARVCTEGPVFDARDVEI